MLASCSTHAGLNAVSAPHKRGITSRAATNADRCRSAEHRRARHGWRRRRRWMLLVLLRAGAVLSLLRTRLRARSSTRTRTSG